MAAIGNSVRAIRRMLGDRPVADHIAAAITDTNTPTFTITNPGLWSVGQVWEHDDAVSQDAVSAERRLVTAVSGTLITAERGSYDTTATTHSIATPLLSRIILDPRFPYDSIFQAMQVVVDSDLYNNDVFDIVEHQITSSTTTDTYEVPTTECERFLNVYQRPASDPSAEPQYITNFSRKLYNADTSLYSTGKFAVIRDNRGEAGTDVYYVNCAHKFAIQGSSIPAQRIIQHRACYYLLTWGDIQRHAGPTNQGDRTVQPLSMTRLAQFYKVESERMMKEEASYIKEFINPAGGKRFIREGIR